MLKEKKSKKRTISSCRFAQVIILFCCKLCNTSSHSIYKVKRNLVLPPHHRLHIQYILYNVEGACLQYNSVIVHTDCVVYFRIYTTWCGLWPTRSRKIHTFRFSWAQKRDGFRASISIDIRFWLRDKKKTALYDEVGINERFPILPIGLRFATSRILHYEKPHGIFLFSVDVILFIHLPIIVPLRYFPPREEPSSPHLNDLFAVFCCCYWRLLVVLTVFLFCFLCCCLFFFCWSSSIMNLVWLFSMLTRTWLRNYITCRPGVFCIK